MPKHYELSPSASTRVLNCPGSLELSKRYPPREAGEAADFGHFEHALGANVLLREGGGDWEEIANAFQADADTIDAVSAYVDFIELGRTQRVKDGGVVYRFNVEETIQSNEIEGFGGTTDYWEIGRHASRPLFAPGVETLDVVDYVRIVDYKSGRGEVVAKDNDQLLAYAALLFERFPYVDRWELAIVQPRTPGPPVDLWVTDRDRVRWQHARFATVKNRLHQFQPGAWCRYCPALAYCDAAAKEVERMAAIDFAAIPDEQLPEVWADTLAKADLVQGILDTIPGKMLSALKQGQNVPGYKAVEAFGQRRWRWDEKETLRQLSKRGVGKRVATKSSLLSPAQLEKIVEQERIADLFERPSRGLVVVPETDRRPGVAFETPAEIFR